MIEPFLFFGSVYNCNVKHLPRWCCCGCKWESAWGGRQSHSDSDLVMDCTANAFEFVEEPSLQMLTVGWLFDKLLIGKAKLFAT